MLDPFAQRVLAGGRRPTPGAFVPFLDRHVDPGVKTPVDKGFLAKFVCSKMGQAAGRRRVPSGKGFQPGLFQFGTTAPAGIC